jgi:hypothetical protein
MSRWLEEFELKHIEFIRCIRSFQTMHFAWAAMASKAVGAGRTAFARRQSTMYLDLHNEAKDWFARKGETRFVNLANYYDTTSFVDAVRQFRERELGWLIALAGESG